MFENKLFQIIIGGIVLLFSSLALITHNEDMLLLPFVQFALGLIVAWMINSGISAFGKNDKRWGFVFILIALIMIVIIIANNTMTIQGIVPVLTIFIVGGVPIGIIAMFSYRLENRNKL